jgi:hypothetical protein
MCPPGLNASPKAGVARPADGTRAYSRNENILDHESEFAGESPN